MTRPGDTEVPCKIKILLDIEELRFKLHPFPRSIFGVRIQTIPQMLSTLWNYVKLNKLQDSNDNE